MTATVSLRAARIRQWLAGAAAMSLLLAVATAAALLIAMLIPTTWKPLGNAETLRQPTPQLLNIDGHELYLVWADNQPIAFNTADPHGPFNNAACHIRFEPSVNRFIDPCGGSTYELDGSYVRGPSPRSLDRFATRINQGQLEINVSTVLPGKAHL